MVLPEAFEVEITGLYSLSLPRARVKAECAGTRAVAVNGGREMDERPFDRRADCLAGTSVSRCAPNDVVREIDQCRSHQPASRRPERKA